MPLPRSSLDITNPAEIRSVLDRWQPLAFINCAAWTAVDAAETQTEACFAANANAVASLASACRTTGTLLVQVSTDYVFGADRTRDFPYCEEDATGPLNAYGSSKLAGELAARGYDNHLIVRTCGLYSVGDNGPVRGRNFLDTMLSLALDRPEVSVVSDQFCTPSYVPHVARGILGLMAAAQTGTFHVTNSGGTSWHALAEELFQQAGKATRAKPIAAREYPSKVERPSYSVLNTKKLANVLTNGLPDWRQGVADYAKDTLKRIPSNLFLEPSQTGVL